LDESHSGTFAVSRSVHYGVFLVFEGIRFFVREEAGGLTVAFLNLQLNLDRFRRGIAFNLPDHEQDLVPTADVLRDLFMEFLSQPELRPFLLDMARDEAQGYLRPFTVDDERAIGVTFPGNPTIRVVASRYDSYLGEPFHGVAVPWLVRTVGINQTGCLKLGGNYLLSVKAVQEARRIRPDASSALFLDDRPYDELSTRKITEWDSSCSLFAFTDGTVVRIPDNPLILPSVTVRGLHRILTRVGVPVQERGLTYGELVERAQAGEVVTVCSVGTAGVLSRCASLLLTDADRQPITLMESQREHPLYDALWAARAAYWDLYRGLGEPLDGITRTTHLLE